jgi:hypothetical protein
VAKNDIRLFNDVVDRSEMFYCILGEGIRARTIKDTPREMRTPLMMRMEL